MGQRAATVLPTLRFCRSCQVAWDLGRCCWMCAAPSFDLRQLKLNSLHSCASVAGLLDDLPPDAYLPGLFGPWSQALTQPAPLLPVAA